MKYKLLTLLSQVQSFGMAPWQHGLQAISNTEIVDHLITNRVAVQEKPYVCTGVNTCKGYALTADSLTEILQELIDASGVNKKVICEKAGISLNTLYRCMSDQGNISLISLECLLEAMGKELVIVDKKGR